MVLEWWMCFFTVTFNSLFSLTLEPQASFKNNMRIFFRYREKNASIPAHLRYSNVLIHEHIYSFTPDKHPDKRRRRRRRRSLLNVRSQFCTLYSSVRISIGVRVCADCSRGDGNLRCSTNVVCRLRNRSDSLRPGDVFTRCVRGRCVVPPEISTGRIFATTIKTLRVVVHKLCCLALAIWSQRLAEITKLYSVSWQCRMRILCKPITRNRTARLHSSISIALLMRPPANATACNTMFTRIFSDDYHATTIEHTIVEDSLLFEFIYVFDRYE